MQYENVFKVIGVVHVILASLKSCSAAQTTLKMASGTGPTQMDQRLLTNTRPKTIHDINIQANTNKSYETVHQYIKTAH